MFQRMIDDFKDSTGIAVRLTSLAIAAAFALFVTTCFLCAAAFLFVLERYGAIEACLAGVEVLGLDGRRARRVDVEQVAFPELLLRYGGQPADLVGHPNTTSRTSMGVQPASTMVASSSSTVPL